MALKEHKLPNGEIVVVGGAWPDDIERLQKEGVKIVEPSEKKPKVVPSSLDLRPYAGRVRNQGALGSCVANAGCSAMELFMNRVKGRNDGSDDVDLSRLFNYNSMRANWYPEGQMHDGGAAVDNSFNYGKYVGVCDESVYPYDPSKVNERPPKRAYELAIKNRVFDFYYIKKQSDGSHIDLLKDALANGNTAAIFGMKLGHQFYNISGPLEDQNYPPINDADNPFIGAHAMNIVGYDDNLNNGSLIVENSWGTGWGDNGFFALRYDVMQADGWGFYVLTEFYDDLMPFNLGPQAEDLIKRYKGNLIVYPK